VGVADTMGGCVVIGICEIMGADGIMLWVVDKGIVDMAGAIDVSDVVVKAGTGPSYESTGGKEGEGNVQPVGAGVE
ncbi:hypothetical protein KI387_039246, partial [Taxus chinensis]